MTRDEEPAWEEWVAAVQAHPHVAAMTPEDQQFVVDVANALVGPGPTNDQGREASAAESPQRAEWIEWLVREGFLVSFDTDGGGVGYARRIAPGFVNAQIKAIEEALTHVTARLSNINWSSTPSLPPAIADALQSTKDRASQAMQSVYGAGEGLRPLTVLAARNAWAAFAELVDWIAVHPTITPRREDQEEAPSPPQEDQEEAPSPSKPRRTTPRRTGPPRRARGSQP